jgi:phosphoribosyl 1,2-cyclic phosphodiesterase
MEMPGDMFVRFWGTRGSIPTPGEQTQTYGGNTACVEVRIGKTLFICDAGSGIRELGQDLMARAQGPIEAHMLFSHSHWDHIQGFPYFAPAYVPGNHLVIYGREEGDDRFHRLLSGQMESDYFPVSFSDLRAVVVPAHLDHGRKIIGGVEVACHPLAHPGGSLAYSFSSARAKVVYATDNEIPFDPSKGDALRSAPAGLVSFCRGARLLIADGQYSDEMFLRYRGRGHSSWITATDLALQAEVAQLAIFHHDPDHNDSIIDAMVEECREHVRKRNGQLTVFAAREGVELKF